VRHTGRRCL